MKPPVVEGGGFKRKSPIVGRRNFQEKQKGENNYSGGAAVEAVRLATAKAVQCRWSLGNGDIKKEFLPLE